MRPHPCQEPRFARVYEPRTRRDHPWLPYYVSFSIAEFAPAYRNRAHEESAVTAENAMIPVGSPSITEREGELAREAAMTAWGPDPDAFNRRFEEMFAGYIGVRHAVSLPHATAGLHLVGLAVALLFARALRAGSGLVLRAMGAATGLAGALIALG